MVSLKKIFLSSIILATLLLWTENILLIHKQIGTSSTTTAPSAMRQRNIALAAKQPIISPSKLLNVPLIYQFSPPRLYNGCEVTSLAMILNYNGYHVTKNELAEEIKTVPFTYRNGLKGNPNSGFVGDMDDGPGLGVYNGPIYALAQKYAGAKAVNLTNSPFTDLLRKINEGEPVWVIITSDFAPVSIFEKWPTPQGTINITFREHSAVMTGYDSRYIYVNNPYGDKNQKLNRISFQKAWEQMGSQAIVIEKNE